MIELKEYNGKKYASARDLHKWLEIKKAFTHWFNQNSIRLGFIENSDFMPFRAKSTGGRPSIDYLLNQDNAIAICAASGGTNANNVRKELIQAFKEKQTGILINQEQYSAINDMVQAMTLVSNQKFAENKHYYFLNKPKDWWDYRAKLFGYSSETLKSALIKINIRYKNQRQALIHLDPAEIIRMAIVDILISLGRDKEFAMNIGDFAKTIAKKNGYHLQIWDDTKPNPLGINQPIVNNRKSLMEKIS